MLKGKNKFAAIALALAMTCGASAQRKVSAPAPCGPVPNANQLRWHKLETYAFLHYSLNTYTDQEWGFGDEDTNLFNPSDLDARQWARTCKEAGMKGIILTAKHHCGFCLWPSKYTEFSVKNAPWKNGKGDVVRELADACKEYGLKFAVYLSPWDRNHPEYGRPEYVTYFRNQLEELLTQYGEMFEVWFDGANGGTGYYGGANEARKIDGATYYDWPKTFEMIHKWQPKLAIWGDRAELRWIGTEKGYAGLTNWCTIDYAFNMPQDTLMHGQENGKHWSPGECDTSIRPGWFYHDTEDSKVKSLRKLVDTYYESVGRNASLLLNFPITREGRIHPIDSAHAVAMARVIKAELKDNLATKASIKASQVRGGSAKYNAKKAIDNSTETYWATNDGVTRASLTLNFKRPTDINRFMAQEYIALGQRVKSFSLEALVNGKWVQLRDERAPEGKTGLTTIGYKRIVCFPTVKATSLRFTINSAKACPLISNIGVYCAPALPEDAVQLPASVLAKANEKLPEPEPVTLALGEDGPKAVDIDLQEARVYHSLTYVPKEGTKDGLVLNYEIYASDDLVTWKRWLGGEFSNIENNPVAQTVKLPAIKTRYLKLVATRLLKGDKMAWQQIIVR